jgi:hypothetical protein
MSFHPRLFNDLATIAEGQNNPYMTFANVHSVIRKPEIIGKSDGGRRTGPERPEIKRHAKAGEMAGEKSGGTWSNDCSLLSSSFSAASALSAQAMPL